MFKYDKVSVKKPDSLLALALSIFQFILIISGLAGISVQLFREHGWLRKALASLVNAELSTVLVALPVMLVIYLAGKSWRARLDREKSSRIADAMLYLMMALGAWFIYSYLAHGTI